MMVFLKVWWKWIGVGLIVAALLWALDHERGRADRAAQATATATAAKDAAEERETRLVEERKVLIANTAKWAETERLVRQLAADTAQARAIENAALTNIAARVAAAKEGIRHAPGADDRFTFSDPAYGLLRGQAGAAGDGAGRRGGGAEQAPSGVGAR